MTEVEVERIVVRLVGDGSSFQKMMSSAQKQAKQVTNDIAADIDGFGRRLSRFGELAVAGLGIYGVKSFLEKGLQAWAEQEAAAIKLTAVLEANGRNVQELTTDYAAFSTEMQRVTTMADEVTLGILAQAESFGLTGDAAKMATQAAIGLAAMNDGNAGSYLRFTAAMARGDTEMMKHMARMIPQLRGIKNETELMAKAQLLVKTGWETAQKQAQTFTGQLTQLKNAWGEILEDVGKTVSEFLKPFVKFVKEGVEWLQKLTDSTKQVSIYAAMAIASIALIGPFMATFAATAVPLFRMMEDGFTLIALGLRSLLNPMAILRVGLAAIGLLVSTIFSPMAAVIALVGVAFAVLVEEFGGIQPLFAAIKDVAVSTWDWIKKSAQSMWAEVQPIFQVMRGAFDAVVSNIGRGISSIWKTVGPVLELVVNKIREGWEWLANETGISWGKIKDEIIDTFLYIEYSADNFSEAWELAAVSAAYQMTKTFNIISHFFTGTMPAFLNWLSKNWRTIFTDMLNFTATVFTNLSENIGRLIIAIGGAIATGDWNFVWKPLLDGFQAVTEQLVIPERVMGDIERQLKLEMDALGDQLGEGFAAFRDRRLREMAAPGGPFSAGNNPFTAISDGAKDVTKEIKKMDAAIFGSAESISRIEDYITNLHSGKQVGQSNRAPVGGGAMFGMGAGGGAAGGNIVNLLVGIREGILTMVNKPTVTVEPIGLGD